MSTMEKEKKVENPSLEQAKNLPEPPSFYPTPEKLNEYEKMAKFLIKAGLGIKDKENEPIDIQIAKIELKLMFCEAIGLPAIMAQSVYPVQGKCELEVDAIMFLIATRCKTAEFEVLKYSTTEVSIKTRRSPSSQWVTATWTIEKAKKQLSKAWDPVTKKWAKGKENWEEGRIPDQMLRSRCLGELGRTVYYLELRGFCYTRGEISDNIPVQSDPVINMKIPSVPTNNPMADPPKDVKPPLPTKEDLVPKSKPTLTHSTKRKSLPIPDDQPAVVTQPDLPKTTSTASIFDTHAAELSKDGKSITITEKASGKQFIVPTINLEAKYQPLLDSIVDQMMAQDHDLEEKV